MAVVYPYGLKQPPMLGSAAVESPLSADKLFPSLPDGTIIKGQTYCALDNLTQEQVAIKLESVAAKKQVLKLEVAILKKLQDSPYITRFISCGHLRLHSATTYNYMVMSLLSQNISDLRKRRHDNRFSLSTVALLGRQMVEALQWIHDCGYLHRDVKPSNFAMSLDQHLDHRGVLRTRCYIIDFGLSRRFITAEGAVREARESAGFRGTARYASITAHEGRELARRDDLWSLFYLLVEFSLGQLPWRREKDKDRVYIAKKAQTDYTLIASLPIPFTHFYNYLNTLQYATCPSYDYLCSLMDDIFRCSDEDNDVLYDWEKRDEHSELISESALTLGGGVHTSYTMAQRGACNGGTTGGALLTSMRKTLENTDISREDYLGGQGMDRLESDVVSVLIANSKPPLPTTFFSKLKRTANDLHQKLTRTTSAQAIPGLHKKNSNSKTTLYNLDDTRNGYDGDDYIHDHMKSVDSNDHLAYVYATNNNLNNSLETPQQYLTTTPRRNNSQNVLWDSSQHNHTTQSNTSNRKVNTQYNKHGRAKSVDHRNINSNSHDGEMGNDENILPSHSVVLAASSTHRYAGILDVSQPPLLNRSPSSYSLHSNNSTKPTLRNCTPNLPLATPSPPNPPLTSPPKQRPLARLRRLKLGKRNPDSSEGLLQGLNLLSIRKKS